MAKAEFEARHSKPGYRIGARLTSVAIVGLLFTAGCGPSFADPNQAPKLSSYYVAKYCGEGEAPSGFLNPGLSEEQEKNILDMVYDIEGHDNFPSNSQSRSMFMYDHVAPRLSPDESLVAYASIDSRIVIVDRDGMEPTELTAPPAGGFDTNHVWSSDGKYIAFERRFPFENRSEIHIVSIDGTGETTVTTAASYVWDERPKFLENGRIIFAERNNTVRNNEGYTSSVELFTVNPDGSDKRQIKLDDAFLHSIRYFVISGDKTRVAISSSNKPTVFKNFSGGGAIGRDEPDSVYSILVFDSKTEGVKEIDRDDQSIEGVKWTGNDEYLRYMRDLKRGSKDYLASVDGKERYECPPLLPDEEGYF